MGRKHSRKSRTVKSLAGMSYISDEEIKNRIRNYDNRHAKRRLLTPEEVGRRMRRIR